MRKIVFAVLLLAVAVSGTATYLSKKAPLYLRRAIERSMNKTVQIEAIHYQFPWSFRLEKVRLLETDGPFLNEPCFEVSSVLLELSPLSLSRKELVVDNLEVRGAKAVIRQRGGKLWHAFSGAMDHRSSEPAVSAPETASEKGPRELPLKIRRFLMQESQFQFVDYDVRESGFVSQLDRITANVKDISFPPDAKRTLYRAEAAFSQGRDESGAPVRISGWTRFLDKETDAILSANNLYLPYFTPYLSQVTPATIEEGTLSLQASLRVKDGLFTTDADLEFAGLFFASYEEGEELFGMKAQEILAFFKDASGYLKFHITLEWPVDDRTFDKRRAVRKAIEESLKRTLLGNAGNILERTLQKLADDGLDASKGDLEDTLKKVKKLFQ